MVRAGAGGAAQPVDASKEWQFARDEPGLRPSDSMEDIVGRMAQMEAMIQALRNENLTQPKQQPQDTLLQTATTCPVQNVQMERLTSVFADPVRVLSESSRVTLVDVKGVGKPSFSSRTMTSVLREAM